MSGVLAKAFGAAEVMTARVLGKGWSEPALAAAAARVERNPTPAQARAGNYRKGHVRIHGLDVAIENPAGSYRRGVDPGGKPWKARLPAHYGYVKRTEGADGDHVDVFIGPARSARSVYVVDQQNPDTGAFDEHKCLLGYHTQLEALAAYYAAFSDGKGPARVAAVTAMPVDAFKRWLRDGDTTAPLAKWEEALHPRDALGRFAPAGAAGPAVVTHAAPQVAAAARRDGANLWDYGQTALGSALGAAAAMTLGRKAAPYARRFVHGDHLVYASGIVARAPDLTHAEWWAMVRYPGGGLQQSFSVNAELRNGASRFHGLIRDLSSAIEKMPLPRHLTTWRGTSAGFDVSHLKPGDEFFDPGFLSVSTKKAVAEEYGAGGTIWRIDLPKGVNAAPVEEFTARWLGRDLGEIVLKPRQAFEVLSNALREDGTRLVHLRAKGDSLAKVDDGNALEKARKPKLVEMAEAAEADIADAFGDALDAFGDGVDDIVDAASGGPAAAAEAVPVDLFEDRSDGAFKKLIGLFRRAGQQTANESLPPDGGDDEKRVAFNFDLGNQRTLDFLTDYRMGLIRQITDDQRELVRSVVADAVAKGEPTDAMARRIRDVIGLTDAQAASVETYRAALESLDPSALERELRDARFDRTLSAAIEAGEPLDGEQIDKMVAAYRRRALDMRATTIARTESLTAASMGSRMAIQQMLDDPEMVGLTVERTWHATHDSRSRADHMALDGQVVVGMDTPYVLPDGTTILHPHDLDAPAGQRINCRCYESRRLVRQDNEGDE